MTRRTSSPCGPSLSKKVIALVVDDDEGGEIDHLDLLDAVLREPCRRAANRAQIEAAMLFARSAHLGAAIAFGEANEAAACGHELVDIGIHAAGGGGRMSPRQSLWA